MNSKIILTGDRPTGKLHIGHYVGSLKNRIECQNSGKYDIIFIMIANAQALTDNFKSPEKVCESVIEVAKDYLAIGLDPKKCTMFVQSEIPELTELTFYYMNLVTLERLKRNPTVKQELAQKNFGTGLPVGFLCYPISQCADITAFEANIVPVGEDQLPMLEQTREIVRSFNAIYGDTLIEPTALLPSKTCMRLPGLDGKSKMSKSLGNCIYLADTPEEIKTKVFSMYTDPEHVHVADAGKIEGNMVFTYLDVFCTQEHLKRFLPEYSNLEDLKNHYKRGGLGDVTIKNLLAKILIDIISPISQKRLTITNEQVLDVLKKGNIIARQKASETLKKVKHAMKLDMFNN
ncbi:MAG: tryptophan--tRNA ligase [Clostridia bacterium]